MLAQLKNQDPTSPVDSNTFLNAARRSSAKCRASLAQHLVQFAVEFAHLQSSAAGLLAARTPGAGRPAATAALTANGTVTGAVNVPQTSSQVVLNITDSERRPGADDQSRGAVRRTREFLVERQGRQRLAGARRDLHLERAVAGADQGSTAATTLVNGTVESVSMGAGSTGLDVERRGLGSVPFSSVQQISN